MPNLATHLTNNVDNVVGKVWVYVARAKVR
jgi:hypothetical protein